MLTLSCSVQYGINACFTFKIRSRILYEGQPAVFQAALFSSCTVLEHKLYVNVFFALDQISLYSKTCRPTSDGTAIMTQNKD
jgi:hypothetical protein